VQDGERLKRRIAAMYHVQLTLLCGKIKTAPGCCRERFLVESATDMCFRDPAEIRVQDLIAVCDLLTVVVTDVDGNLDEPILRSAVGGVVVSDGVVIALA